MTRTETNSRALSFRLREEGIERTPEQVRRNVMEDAGNDVAVCNGIMADMLWNEQSFQSFVGWVRYGQMPLVVEELGEPAYEMWPVLIWFIAGVLVGSLVVLIWG